MVRSVPSAANVRTGTSVTRSPSPAMVDVFHFSRSSNTRSATSTATIVTVRMISGASAW
jgi:hypothetical protein